MKQRGVSAPDIECSTVPIDRQLLEAAFQTPIEYIAVLHQLIDGGLTGLTASAQLVYLFFIRETLAKQREHLRISIRRIQEATGFSKDTIGAAIKALSSPEVDLIQVVSAGVPHTPARYQVRVGRYQRRPGESSATKTRVRVKPSRFSIESGLQDLTTEDQELLRQTYDGLPASERRRYEEQVQAKLADLGVRRVPATMLLQCVLFEVMRETMFHRIKRNPAYAKTSPLHG